LWQTADLLCISAVTHQEDEDLCISKGLFQNLVFEIAEGFKSDVRFTQSAMDDVQEAAEEYLISLMKGANLCAG